MTAVPDGDKSRLKEAAPSDVTSVRRGLNLNLYRVKIVTASLRYQDILSTS